MVSCGADVTLTRASYGRMAGGSRISTIQMQRIAVAAGTTRRSSLPGCAVGIHALGKPAEVLVVWWRARGPPILCACSDDVRSGLTQLIAQATWQPAPPRQPTCPCPKWCAGSTAAAGPGAARLDGTTAAPVPHSNTFEQGRRTVGADTTRAKLQSAFSGLSLLATARCSFGPQDPTIFNVIGLAC
jgi:hypothetical protein